MPGIDSNTKLILHCDGSNGSTTFTDSSSSPKTVTGGGSAQISTAQSKFGGASLRLDSSTSDYLTSADNADFELGSSDFTIDLWVRMASIITGGTTVFVAKYLTTGNQRSYMFAWDEPTGNMQFRYSTDGGSATTLTQSWSPSTNTWYHIAVVRNGSNFKMFVDGTQLGSTDTISGTLFDSSSTSLDIGGFQNGTLGGLFDGWMDEIRISNTARWTANFTPPSSAYSADTATQILYPGADSVDGNWTDDAGGTTLYAAIDETTPSNTDYIQSELLSAGTSACRVKLQSGLDPLNSTNHIIKWRIGKDAAGGATIGMVVKLYQGGGNSIGGGTLIASFTRSNVSDTITEYSETLSGGQADAITDYTDLYLEFSATAT